MAVRPQHDACCPRLPPGSQVEVLACSAWPLSALSLRATTIIETRTALAVVRNGYAQISKVDFSRRWAKSGAVSAGPADGIGAASYESGEFGSSPFCGQLLGAHPRQLQLAIYLPILFQ